MLHLILGGAALQRCDMRIVFSSGFSHWGHDAGRDRVFSQVVQSCHQVAELNSASAPEVSFFDCRWMGQQSYRGHRGNSRRKIERNWRSIELP